MTTTCFRFCHARTPADQIFYFFSAVNVASRSASVDGTVRVLAGLKLNKRHVLAAPRCIEQIEQNALSARNPGHSARTTVRLLAATASKFPGRLALKSMSGDSCGLQLLPIAGKVGPVRRIERRVSCRRRALSRRTREVVGMDPLRVLWDFHDCAPPWRAERKPLQTGRSACALSSYSPCGFSSALSTGPGGLQSRSLRRNDLRKIHDRDVC